MANIFKAIALILGFGLAGHAAADDGDKPKVPALRVKLGKLPDVRLPVRLPVSDVQAKKVKDLIARLADLDAPDFGLSATLSGETFAPIPGMAKVGVALIANHGVRKSDTMKELVALGPVALPFLLDALNDPTPTKITINHDILFGSMWHAAELPLCPVNPAEHLVYQARLANPRDKEERVKSYTVKLGDVCFVAVGQIVGRSYQAVRYQPSACVVLNCPTRDATLRAEVRAIWKSGDPSRKLFESLLADYSIVVAVQAGPSEYWSSCSRLQCGAATRLLFYFPKETVSLVAQRLGRLDVSQDREPDGYQLRCLANGGVRAEDFVRAVVWSKDPAIREALVAMFKRATNPSAMMAALPAVEDVALIRSRLEPLLDNLPTNDGGPYGSGSSLLLALGQRTPETAKPFFNKYLKTASAERCHAMCGVLGELKPTWDVEMLAPLLSDTRTWGYNYALDPGQNEPRRPIRVCDEAAGTLSRHYPDLRFVLAGEHADLDRQIAVIRERLTPKR